MQKTVIAMSLVCTLTTVSAHSYQAGDWIIRAGIASVQPEEDSEPLTLNNVELSSYGLPLSTASVNNNEQLGITVAYMLSPSWGIELLAATPFSHEIYANGLEVEAAEVKHLPPTLSGQYYFSNEDSAFQPYAGLGLNYTVFFDEKVDNELNNALIDLGATGDTELELDSSLSYSLEIGADYNINDKLLVNIAIWYIDIDTTATFTTPGLGEIEADVEIDPLVFMASIGFKL